jgi:hypothetical protein
VSNSRIARELEMLHLKHVYGKLDVNIRMQAVARFRELNLRYYPSEYHFRETTFPFVADIVISIDSTVIPLPPFNKIPLPIPLLGDDISLPG